METETVEITDFGALPSAITRKPGPFILHLLNKTRVAPPDLDWAVSSGPAAQVANLKNAADLTTFANLRRQLSVIDVLPGQYVLKSKTGKLFLTITIK